MSSELVKYIHLERLGTDLVDGITIGKCHIFPKLDGTNASIWYDENGDMQCGSRNRVLSLDKDNQDFMAWAIDQPQLYMLLDEFPVGTRVYGEWLVPHSLKTYESDAWNRFYVFDVLLPDGTFVHYDIYSALCKRYGIDFIPCVSVVTNPTYEFLVKETEKNTFLIQSNSGIGEGIVIKQYGWRNKFGNTTWAKLVTSSFKYKHIVEMGGSVVNFSLLEEKIVDEFVTEHQVDKALAKIWNKYGLFQSKNIPELFSMVYYDFVTEELWEVLRKYKNPKIDFGILYHLLLNRVKDLQPELFVRKVSSEENSDNG